MATNCNQDLESELSLSDTSDEDQLDELFSEVDCVFQLFNRLRDQTKPLLSVDKVSSPLKQLRECGSDKVKDSRSKKRLTRAKQDPPNGFIERRYGYIPNPRWPKPPFMFNKQFEPKGVGANDASCLQGISFRNKSKESLRNSVSHSYVESDFPELTFSSGNGSFTTSTPSEKKTASDSLTGSSDRTKSPMSWSQVAKVSPSAGSNYNLKLQDQPVEKKTNRGEFRNTKKKDFVKTDQETNPQSMSRNCSTQIQLEDFVTPKKQIGKKNESAMMRKNISMLESRFVEQIEANATSPPKKVRPSPVKKLTLSKNNGNDKSVVDASGDAKNSVDHIPVQGSKNKENRIKLKFNAVNTSSVSKRVLEKKGPVLSLESLLATDNSSYNKQKDIFEDENEDEDEYTNSESSVSIQVENFWKVKPLTVKQTDSSGDFIVLLESSEDEDDVPDLSLPCAKLIQKSDSDCNESGFVSANPSKVTHKQFLKKMSRRYCHFIEEHMIPNLSVELYFIMQLLTCRELDTDVLQYVDNHLGGTYFRSVHNGVYFAVQVIRRLRSLFLCLDDTYLTLLAASERILIFSPKLHTFFEKASERRKKVPIIEPNIGHNTFNPEAEGIFSFPDPNYAHVFKCQRDNFYAFYRHYHDVESIYEFKIENQIQYVYDGCTPEQNSMFNLIHLAQLFVEHIILCCVHQTIEKVDVKMIQSKENNLDLFNSLCESFMATYKNSDFTACPAPGFTESQMFFKDFLETLSCPAFNEHLRNLVVQKILQLNSDDYGTVRNLHSILTVEEDQIPLRCQKFTESVLTMCVLAKLLGYLTFSPYNISAHVTPPEHTAPILQMRELIPLPLPLHLLIKEAFERGHLSLTVPWIVDYLSMMDPLASRLPVYSSLLKKLHYIQKYTWANLYKDGHTNTAVLIVSCISWLFEATSVPSDCLISCDTSLDEKHLCDSRNTFNIDRQKLVTHRLLSLSCPYIEQGQSLLILFSLDQNPISRERDVLPVIPVSKTTKPDRFKPVHELQELEKWLNSSLSLSSETNDKSEYKQTSVIDDEVIPSYVLTRQVISKDGDELAELEGNFIQNNPYVKASVNMAVDLVTAKIFDYAIRTILRVLVFEVKVEIRSQFVGVSQSSLSDTMKDRIIAQSYIMAQRYTDKAKASFFEVVDKCCSKELPDLVAFLTSGCDQEVQKCSIHISQRLVMERVKEWAQVQIYSAFFQRIITKEVEKCKKGNFKHTSLYPSDFSKKLDSLQPTELSAGFGEMEQLSELIDKALSNGVWYINALTPGLRPDGTHMVKLIEDFIRCVEKNMVTMDFAFYVMSNFLMHLIIQYIVDAPQNWTDQAAQSFLKLCHLCKAKKLENDQQAVKLSESVKKKKRMKVKVVNLMSVHSLVWLTKSDTLDETLMVYCKLLYQLVESHLLYIETVHKKLIHSRENKNVSVPVKKVINRIIIKVLEMLWETPDNPQILSFSKKRIMTILQDMVSSIQMTKKSEWNELTAHLATLKSYLIYLLYHFHTCITDEIFKKSPCKSLMIYLYKTSHTKFKYISKTIPFITKRLHMNRLITLYL
ncbi:hypothetical protein Btru_003186 [Bulinus truncatus]|nr:hypothetical protein Btru_003186 [Bulinus truncatus]